MISTVPSLSRVRRIRLPIWCGVVSLLMCAQIVVLSAVTFRNDVMAVLSKAGCNAGTCHGNANGKAGFKLSLRGESPDMDFGALTRDAFSRRVNPNDPDQSLMLLKPTGQIAHEGGKRFETNSWEYSTLRQWIADGAGADAANVPVLTRIDVTPAQKIAYDPEQMVQIHAEATFSDGTKRDITKFAVYETANTAVKVSPTGSAQREAFGESTVLVRFLNQQRPVRLAFVPDRPDFKWNKPVANNFIDEQVYAKLKALRMNPSVVCTDEQFVRRAYLDLTGLLPPAEKAKQFVANKNKTKRSKLIDELLESAEYADFWALKWSDLLRNEARTLDQKGVENFHHWIRQCIAENKPMDEFVREIVSARGSTYQNAAANYYRAVRDPIDRAVSSAQVFLGTRLQCAQCHSHPFDRWTQDDYYSWGAAFAKVNYKVLENRRRDVNDSHEFKGEQVVYPSRKAEVKNARTSRPAAARFLGEPEEVQSGEFKVQNEKTPLTPALSRRERESGIKSRDAQDTDALAAWMTSAANPLFARAQVNRLWFNFMGRGIVDPIDDFRSTNPASHPELLEALTREFIAHKFDARHMIRLIMNSRSYQLSSEPNGTNAGDEMNYSHNQLRRLSAEQLIDCEAQVLGAPLELSGFPAGFRAIQVPGANYDRRRGDRVPSMDKFLEVFGKPQRLLTCECERSSDTTMNQAFLMISGPTLNEMLTVDKNWIARGIEARNRTSELITDLYWAGLTRAPSPTELQRHVSFVDSAKDRRAALEDVAWSVLNAKEFVFR